MAWMLLRARRRFSLFVEAKEGGDVHCLLYCAIGTYLVAGCNLGLLGHKVCYEWHDYDIHLKTLQKCLVIFNLPWWD